jgi:murein DD-endopeptidase MepM/ murein hydrolase activator NlpD
MKARLESWFPEREFFMRSQGQVRFVKISSRLQKLAAGAVALVLLVWLVSVISMAVMKYTAESNRLALLEREAKVASAESRVDAYREDLGSTATDLEKRMSFIEESLSELPEDALENGTVSDSSGEASALIEKVSASLPEAVGLAKVEARQLAMVERLTRYADHRAERTADAIRRLGLNPDRILASARSAQGGPLELLSSDADDSIDPRFERLGLSLARMKALEEGLNGIPQVMPADIRSISSGFGYRRDPITGRAAMHRGLDFKGARGSPIHAAAEGVVSFVGWKQGYGKCVEVRHANGMMTRYAHMSAWRTKVGQEVAAGDVIGAIGNTGRSTGPHLHFEVHVNDRAVNPRPFLEAAPHVLEEIRNGNASGEATR